jgi:hypothetical protein
MSVPMSSKLLVICFPLVDTLYDAHALVSVAVSNRGKEAIAIVRAFLYGLFKKIDLFEAKLTVIMFGIFVVMVIFAVVLPLLWKYSLNLPFLIY